jgi:CRP/FNR family cyclic AMP-dependent transcriptional regulator
MKSPYGLDIFESCTTCPVREQHLFCNLSPSAVQRLDDITSAAVYPRASVLFVEGQRPRGVFVLCTGKAKLFTSASDGKTIITKISEGGDVLGLNAIISNRPYEVTAEMIEPGQANFISSEALLQFLRQYREVALRVVEQLSRNYYTAHEEIRTLGLTSSPSGKFAKLLLSWTKEGNAKVDKGLKLTLTHQEIAEIIGTTRETVSRLFSDFKRKQFIQSEASSLVILDKSALERMVQA